jgi:hypothetical protein
MQSAKARFLPESQEVVRDHHSRQKQATGMMQMPVDSDQRPASQEPP